MVGWNNVLITGILSSIGWSFTKTTSKRGWNLDVTFNRVYLTPSKFIILFSPNERNSTLICHHDHRKKTTIGSLLLWSIDFLSSLCIGGSFPMQWAGWALLSAAEHVYKGLKKCLLFRIILVLIHRDFSRMVWRCALVGYPQIKMSTIPAC